MRTVLCIGAIALLAGCATPAEKAAQLQREVDQMIQVYGPPCEKLGFKPDTDPWRECILRLDAKDNDLRARPSTTQCIGHRGFIQCTTF